MKKIKKIVKSKSFIFVLILVISWMGLIFYFSADNSKESDDKSKGIISSVIEKYDVSKEEKEKLLDKYNVYLRKIAHGSVFLVLSVLVCFLVKEFTLDIKKILLISFIVCFLYSCSDEFHQLFVSGRSSEIKDVFIDNIGTLLGLLIFYLSGLKIWRKSK